MQERDTVRCGACGESMPPGAAACPNCGSPVPAASSWSNMQQLYQPEPAPTAESSGDVADDSLPPLPPPPPVGADMPPGDDEDVPEDAFELPPTPVDGALWPGMAPDPASAEADEEEEDLAKLFEHGINPGDPVPVASSDEPVSSAPEPTPLGSSPGPRA